MLPFVSAAFERRLRARDWERGEGKDRTVAFVKVRFQVPKAVFLKIQVFWGCYAASTGMRHRRGEIWFDSLRTQSGSDTSAEGVCDQVGVGVGGINWPWRILTDPWSAGLGVPRNS